MFETLTPPEADKIIRIMGMFQADPRADKVDLGVGVYRDPQGRTPVMAAVAEAEAQIAEAQTTKSYVALSGDIAFRDALRDLILGDSVAPDRVATCATPGGTGAVRQALEMVRRVNPDADIWMPDPTWPNHNAIVRDLGLTERTYRYYDAETGGLDRDGMHADLAQAKAGDVIVLHACCHNPTGADLNADDWADIAALCEQTGAVPFVDAAYLGFGESFEKDTAGLRLLAGRLPEVLIAASCSKNFGIYRERAGLCMAITRTPKARDAVSGLMTSLNRIHFAFPPDHGARIVQVILASPDLKQSWSDELSEMRNTMTANRKALADALREATGSDRFGFLAAHKGMFSLIGATPEQVVRLRDEHGVYVIDDGRMNVAGLTPETIPTVAKAIAEVLA